MLWLGQRAQQFHRVTKAPSPGLGALALGAIAYRCALMFTQTSV